MQTKDLTYSFPQDLVAIKPSDNPRVLSYEKGKIQELQMENIIETVLQPGDLLVLNNTKVIKSRIFSTEGYEILFINKVSDRLWQVLFPASRLKKDKMILPGGIEAWVYQKGLPQILEISHDLPLSYFDQYGEFALPPYIQAARQKRHMEADDQLHYQSIWAKEEGSCAAPTASLHFKNHHLERLKMRGVQLVELTLHVGLGTFLPVKTDRLEDHIMHKEQVVMPLSMVEQIERTKAEGLRVWALGTTVTRALESWSRGLLEYDVQSKRYSGETDIFIRPGFEFKVVQGLLTNFHQPESTLLALVSAFVGKESVLEAYNWAIQRRFRLFSYGDLSVWIP